MTKSELVALLEPFRPDATIRVQASNANVSADVEAVGVVTEEVKQSSQWGHPEAAVGDAVIWIYL